MLLSIDVPDDIHGVLEARWGDVSRRLREDLAVEAFREGVLTLAQVRRLLQLATRWEKSLREANRDVVDRTNRSSSP